MKILKLRFKNINSLAGENEIDFTNPVFAEDGLFAITGKTGSGKSSILDAVSLALYGKTPRVDISVSDNAVLTRGEKDCYAEIEFETAGKRWKAAWMQSLTRTGNLNPVQRKIADADGRIIADKVRSCDVEIVKILGLTFEQFTKVIMLAQGSFTAFLQADKNSKGELLEQITGTEIYGEISKKVFARNKSENEKLTKITLELGAINILSDEEIKDISDEISVFEKEKNRIEGELKQTENAINWITDLKNLTEQIDNARLMLPELEEKLKTTEETFEKTEIELINAKELFTNSEPIFKQVRELDTKISEKEKPLKQAQKEAAQLEADKLKLGTRLKELDAELKKSKNLLEEKQSWAAENSRYEELVTHYSAIERENQELTESCREIERLKSDIEDLEKAVNSKHAAFEKANKIFDEKNKNLADKSAQLKTLQKKFAEILGGKSLSRLQSEKEIITSFGMQVKELLDTEKAMSAHRIEIENYDRQYKQNETSKEELIKAIGTGKIKKADLEEKINLLEENIKFSKIIQSMEEHRRQLKDGEACPLCGSVEHPFAAGNIPQTGEQEKELADRKFQMKEITANVQDNEKELARLEAEQQNILINKEKEEVNLQTAFTKKDAASAEISSICPEFSLPEADNKIEILNKILIDKREELKKTDEIIKQAVKIDNQIILLRDEEIPALRTAKEMAENAKTNAESDKTLAAQNLKIRQDTAQSLIEKYETKHNAFLTKLKKYGTNDFSSLKKCLNEWNENKSQSEELNKLITRLNGDIALNEQELTGRIKAAEEKTLEKVALENEIQSLSSRREELFEQKSVDDEENRLKKIIEETEKAKKEAETEKTNAFTTLESHKAVIKDKESELTKAKEKNITEKSIDELQASWNELKIKTDEFAQKIGAGNQKLKTNADNLKASGRKLEEKEKQQAVCGKWGALNQLIGSSDGKNYRNFAQALTFEHLIGLANKQLQKMSDRYILIRSADSNNPFELFVIDKYQNSEMRTAQNLSGGEKFVVSLSLALGLANMASKNMRIDTMFIDEGFGTLDSDYLDLALNALSNLQSEGKIIGVISHLAELKERIATHIEVVPSGNGCSKIQITG